MRCFACTVVCLASAASAQQLAPFADGFERPLELVADPSSDDRFYIVEQGGTIRIIEDGEIRNEPFLTMPRGAMQLQFFEQGLLGMALHPDWPRTLEFFVNYTAEDGDQGTTRIARFRADSVHAADVDSEQVILALEQPYRNHNSGPVRFGPDGMFYVSLGDGGAANDPHGHGQDLETLLGAIIRIDVRGEPDEGLGYAIPADNPFVGRDDARAEIWSYGWRNPWKFEWDGAGNMWVADVGQNRFEEIHVELAGTPGGANYGWAVMEGLGEFKAGNARRDDPRRLRPRQHRERGLEPPIWVYRHEPIGSITGGYVYEGDAIPGWRGRYFFADWVLQRMWSLRLRDGRADDVAEHTETLLGGLVGGAANPFQISAFGRDNAGELYVIDHRGGVVYKLVP